MKAIQCNQDHIFSAIIDSESKTAEWKLEEAYYMAQGCEVIEIENVVFSQDKKCSHCSILEHNFENLIEEIKESVCN